NNVCNPRCTSCDVGLQKEDVGSIPPERLYSLVEEWAAMGVFQLSLAGGGPVLSPSFARVVRHARRGGLVPMVTPNGWLLTEALRPEDARRLLDRLREMEPVLPRITVTVDCAFSFLFLGRPAEELQALGMVGCPMGDRFATVKWNGDVYPCSHLHGEEFRAGS